MAMRPDSHELFARRRSRNVGVGLVLGAVVVLVFAVSVVKLTQGSAIEGFDHAVRPSLLPEAPR
jgi:hypothetical protein